MSYKNTSNTTLLIGQKKIKPEQSVPDPNAQGQKFNKDLNRFIELGLVEQETKKKSEPTETKQETETDQTAAEPKQEAETDQTAKSGKKSASKSSKSTAKASKSSDKEDASKDEGSYLKQDETKNDESTSEVGQENTQNSNFSM